MLIACICQPFKRSGNQQFLTRGNQRSAKEDKSRVQIRITAKLLNMLRRRTVWKFVTTSADHHRRLAASTKRNTGHKLKLTNREMTDVIEEGDETANFHAAWNDSFITVFKWQPCWFTFKIFAILPSSCGCQSKKPSVIFNNWWLRSELKCHRSLITANVTRREPPLLNCSSFYLYSSYFCPSLLPSGRRCVHLFSPSHRHTCFIHDACDLNMHRHQMEPCCDSMSQLSERRSGKRLTIPLPTRAAV